MANRQKLGQNLLDEEEEHENTANNTRNAHSVSVRLKQHANAEQVW